MSAENKKQAVEGLKTSVQFLDICQVQSVALHEELDEFSAYNSLKKAIYLGHSRTLHGIVIKKKQYSRLTFILY